MSGMRMKGWGWIILALLISCTSVEAKKERYYKQGVEYAAAGKHAEAIIEFKNVAKLDPNHTDAKYQMGLAYLNLGGLPNALQAYRLLKETVDKKPDLWDAQAKLGGLYLASNDLKSAREKAELILKHDPNDLDARLILARIHQRENRLSEAEAAYRQILVLDPKRLSTYYDLSSLYLQKKDVASAESVLKTALSVNSGSVETHLAFATLYQVTDQAPQAEAHYLKAISIAPQNKSLYYLLSGFYLKEKRIVDAEAKLSEAAKLDPTDPEPLIVQADFQLRQGKLQEAEKLLLRAKEIKPDALPAKKKLAALYVAQFKKKEAELILAEIFAKNPNDPDGLFYQGRLLLSEKKGEAEDLFARVIRTEPAYPMVHYFMGLSHLLNKDLQQAKASFSKAIEQNPQDIPARLVLAELYFQSRAYDLATTEVDVVLRQVPNNVQAHLLRGNLSFLQGDVKRAEEAYQKLVTLSPDDAIGYFKLGTLRRAQKKDAEALGLFEKALSRNPKQIEPLVQMVGIDLAHGREGEAFQRVHAQIVAAPQGALYVLLARLYMTKKESQKAEESLMKGIEFDPNDLAAYLALGQLYVQEKRFDQAIAKLDEALARKPDTLSIYMLKGVIYDAQTQPKKAQVEYEKALQINPQFAPAANNLAWIYAEQGGNIDRALTLAQMAKEQFPDDPSVSDTLGWIYYKKKFYLKAVALLKESAEKLPQNFEIRYHLGMAYEKSGDHVLAKEALTEALKSEVPFPGIEVARETLKALQ